MSLRTSPAVTTLRLNRLISRVFISGAYEKSFSDEMLGAVRYGDCVWDVGANIGLYTTEFANRVGVGGKVYVFEPSETNLIGLRSAVSDLPNVSVVPLALEDREHDVHFQQGEDSLGATSRILEGPCEDSSSQISVAMTTGDRLIESGAASLPNVVKIDTEGYEFEVLSGMVACLSYEALRMICMEVHFGILSARRMKGAPAQIERILTRAGFHCRWSNPSHVVASRS